MFLVVKAILDYGFNLLHELIFQSLFFLKSCIDPVPVLFEASLQSLLDSDQSLPVLLETGLNYFLNSRRVNLLVNQLIYVLLGFPE